jgi:hypothetical protein
VEAAEDAAGSACGRAVLVYVDVEGHTPATVTAWVGCRVRWRGMKSATKRREAPQRSNEARCLPRDGPLRAVARHTEARKPRRMRGSRTRVSLEAELNGTKLTDSAQCVPTKRGSNALTYIPPGFAAVSAIHI